MRFSPFIFLNSEGVNPVSLLNCELLYRDIFNVGKDAAEIPVVTVQLAREVFRQIRLPTSFTVRVCQAILVYKPDYGLLDLLRQRMFRHRLKAHNLEVPGSSPGWSTLEIKYLQSFCRCFFFYR